MFTDLIDFRVEKLHNLISKFTNEANSPDIKTERYIKVKSFIYCFNDELVFLSSLISEVDKAKSEIGQKLEGDDFSEDDDNF